MAVTQFSDVQTFVKRDIPTSDQAWVEAKIDEAEILLETYIGDIADWIAVDSAKREPKLVKVVCRMVERVIKNPDGYSTETDGDYAYGRPAGLASGEVYATRTDLRMLGLSRRRRFGSIKAHLPSDSPRNISRDICE